MEQQFDGQRDGEEIVLVFRRHIIALRKGFYSILIPFAIASIPALIFPGELLWFYVAFGALGFGLLLFFYHWIGWYFTIFILTDQRLRQSTQRGFFGKSVIDLPVTKIQNISYTVPGLTGELFGFGTIVIQTYVGDLILDFVHRPGEVYNKLQDVAASASNGRNIGNYEEVNS
jgi:uncharacterized membrane protein YdbT with pleckstrin-like domain